MELFYVKNKVLIFLNCLLAYSSAFPQKEANVWYFGSSGIDFNSGSPIVLINSAMNAYEGCASMSSNAGDLLFYTDGKTVWNKNHVPMSNGTGLLGNISTTQSAIIVPKPGSSTVYYVFALTFNAWPDGLTYSEVDMTLSGGLGDITSTKNVLLHTPCSEKLTAVKNANNSDFLVIAHESNNNQFLVYSVSASGVNPSAIASNTGSVCKGFGYLKASTNGKKLVNAINGNSSKAIDILNFNTATGIVSLDFTIPVAVNSPYGVEFSPDGNRLYVAGNDKNIIQYNMMAGSSTAIIASATSIGTSTTQFPLGALQNAPDGKMYLAKPDKTTLGCISNPNALGTACGFIDDAIDLSPRISAYGLPNFMETYFNKDLKMDTKSQNISCNGLCNGISSVTAIDGLQPYTYNWLPTGGTNNIATGLCSGLYTITVSDLAGTIITNTVNITEPPLVIINITKQDPLCYQMLGMATASALLGTPPYAYIWSDGSTLQAASNLTSGNYTVNIIDANECSETQTVIINPAPSFINIAVISTETITCNGGNDGSIKTSTSGGTPLYYYNWSNGETNQSISNLFAGNYTAMVTDNNGCINTQTVTITEPLGITINIDTKSDTCLQSKGLASTTVNGGIGTYTYNWNDGQTTSTASNLITDNYTIVVTDGNGCVKITTVNISGTTPPIADAGNDVTIKKGEEIQLYATGGGSYNWTPLTGLDNASISDPIANPTTTTTYTLLVIDSNGCMDNDEITVEVKVDCEGDIVFIPNSFSPNNDGNNDILYVRSNCIQTMLFTIYNRWGEKVFESDDVNKGWDGTYNNEVLNNGIFGYIIDAINIQGEAISQKGTISIFR